MRSALFVSALLATALFGGTALAERTSDDTNSRHISSAQDIKERVAHERYTPQTSNVESRSSERAPSRIANFRQKGESYESYGQGPGSASRAGAQSHASHSAAMPSRLQAGRAHGDMVDSSSKHAPNATASASKMTVGSTQSTWSAGGKNVRSFVHSTNDKGQTNNNIHGATASAQKMRLVAGMLMKTAGLTLVHMSWGTTGGDNMSLFPGN